MDAERWQIIKGLFDAAMALDGEKRAAFLAYECSGDEVLRADVERMIASSESSGSFMEAPAASVVADMILGPDAKLSPGQTIGHYEIVSQIGVGGMGEVYLAKDSRLDRNVAVKVLNQKYSADAENLHRFTREAKAASALNHPNILVIHEIGKTGDISYIVSELVKGKTLRDVVSSSEMKVSGVLDIAIQIVSALAAAHRENIVHRDIKPENIMVRDDGYVKVLDFGLAKLIEEKSSIIGREDATKKQNQTAKGVIMGTVNYMSPEQASGHEVDQRTDIFSVGVVIYEMVAGRLPFDGDSVAEVLANLINKDPQPLSRYASHVPAELQRIVAKTLRKEKDERYQTMKGLLADLKDLRESLALDERLERSRPSGSNETAVLHANTADANQRTAATRESFYERISSRKPLFVLALAALLIATTGFGYWYFARRASPQLRSLAVLPLRSLDASDNYLGLGVANEVIGRISRTGKVVVPPTSAVRRFLNEDTDSLTAARLLNADAVLEGNFQRADDRLKVSVNLLRTSDGTSLWSQDFDIRIADILTLQDRVSEQVAAGLRLQLDGSQQAQLTKRATSNPAAYEFYIKGLYSFDQRVRLPRSEWETIIGFFNQAIEADPNFAPAHAQLAYCYALKAVFFEPEKPSWAELARQEVEKAERLDPQIAEAHLVRYQLQYSQYEGYQAEGAVREVLLAQQLDPNVGHGELAYLYLHFGLEDLAAREIEHAFAVDPTSEFARQMNYGLFEIECKYDEYLKQRDVHHDDNMDALSLMGTGRLDEAQKALDDWSARKPTEIVIADRQALLYALKGDFPAAEALIPVILSKHPFKDPYYHHASYDIARVYALEGKTDEAIKWLREADASGFRPYPLFEKDSFLDRIRQTPEFIKFMSEMKAQNDAYKREFS